MGRKERSQVHRKYVGIRALKGQETDQQNETLKFLSFHRWMGVFLTMAKNKVQVVLLRELLKVEVIREKMNDNYFLIDLYFSQDTALETLKLM